MRTNYTTIALTWHYVYAVLCLVALDVRWPRGAIEHNGRCYEQWPT